MKPVLSLVLLALCCCAVHGQEKPITEGQRSIAHQMLLDVKSELKGSYYDPKFNGVDIDARFHEAEQLVASAKSFNQAMGTIPWALDALNDSHTFFVPPPRDFKHSYGFRMEMIGEDCFITAVRPGSPAEKSGIQAGDRVLRVQSITPNRREFTKLIYLLNTLRPLPGIHLEVTKPSGESKTYEFAAMMRQEKQLINPIDFNNELRDAQSYAALYDRASKRISDKVLVWKLPAFNTNEKGADSIVNEAKPYKSVIIDLRGNGGGGTDMLQRLVGGFFDHDFKIGELKARKPEPVLMAKSRGDGSFTGKVLVLIDSSSASASELFARVLQFEKRATILGDTSAGAVMETQFHPLHLGLDRAVFYAVAITHADIILTDGESLEHIGVKPDELILPTAQDLASGRDPALARAVELAGEKISAEEAGKLFPARWPSDFK